MKKIISYVRKMSFEDKTYYSARISIVFNLVLGISKIILSYYQGIFFLVSGIINIFIMVAKLESYLAIKDPTKKSFKYRNISTGILMIIAGVQYAIYMGRMLYSDVELMKYNGFLAVSIAAISFTEMAIAIIGCFKVYGKGHFYRNLKVINLSSAMSSIVLTEVALMSFASDADTTLVDGLFGLIVGILISILGIFILIAPSFSITDHIHNVYQANNTIKKQKIEIPLTHRKIYSNFVYKADIKNSIIDGYIVKTKSPIRKWNIFLKIIIIVLSEILIFPYAIGAIVMYFKNKSLIKKLDQYMTSQGYIKIEESEE